MFFTDKENFFAQFEQPLPIANTNQPRQYPFYAHAQFPIITDTLARKMQHHLLLHYDFHPDFVAFFLRSLVNFCQQNPLPTALKHAQWIYLHWHAYRRCEQALTSACSDLVKYLDPLEHYLVIAITQAEQLEWIPHCQLLLSHPKCRLLVFTPEADPNLDLSSWQTLTLAPLNKDEHLRILQTYRRSLEEHHQVVIRDSLLRAASQLAQYYLPADNLTYQSILLLDSAAARTSTIKATANKPNMKVATLYNVMSDWAQIPRMHFASKTVINQDAVAALKQMIFGQDPALYVLAQSWQTSNYRSSRRCNYFLFVGPKHVGKFTTAKLLAEKMLGTAAIFVLENTEENIANSACIHLATGKMMPLWQVIYEKPYAIIIVRELIQQHKQWLQVLLRHHISRPTTQKMIPLHHITFIFTSTLGSEAILSQAKQETPEVNDNNMLQLLTKEARADYGFAAAQLTEELVYNIHHTLSLQLPPAFLEKVTVVPFIPLNQTALTAITKQAIQTLSMSLSQEYQIDISITDVVINYFSQRMLNTDIENASLIPPILDKIRQHVLHALTQQPNLMQQLIIDLNSARETIIAHWQTHADRVLSKTSGE